MEELWTDGVKDYLEHAEKLLKDFQDVLADGADKPGGFGIVLHPNAVHISQLSGVHMPCKVGTTVRQTSITTSASTDSV